MRGALLTSQAEVGEEAGVGPRRDREGDTGSALVLHRVAYHNWLVPFALKHQERLVSL